MMYFYETATATDTVVIFYSFGVCCLFIVQTGRNVINQVTYCFVQLIMPNYTKHLAMPLVLLPNCILFWYKIQHFSMLILYTCKYILGVGILQDYVDLFPVKECRIQVLAGLAPSNQTVASSFLTIWCC